MTYIGRTCKCGTVLREHTGDMGRAIINHLRLAHGLDYDKIILNKNLIYELNLKNRKIIKSWFE